MISEYFSVDGFNARHKDGYYLISQDRVSEKGSHYKTEDKTFASFSYAQDHLKERGIDNNDAALILHQARKDYERKESEAFITSKENARKKALDKAK